MRCVQMLHQHAKKNAILIFGSAAIDFRKANDIDILIEGKISKKLQAFLESKVFRFEVINVRDLKNVSGELTEEVKKKHLLIEGSEELIRWMYNQKPKNSTP